MWQQDQSVSGITAGTLNLPCVYYQAHGKELLCRKLLYKTHGKDHG
jgi:hypothetical protein